jgi:hypothetical protein
MVTRRGKRSIVGVDGVFDDEDYNQFDEQDTNDESNHADGADIPTAVDNIWKRTTIPENIDLPCRGIFTTLAIRGG